MQQSYHEVGTLVDALAVESGYTELDKVGTEVCSAFQSSPKVDKIFLEPHTDTHSLPTLFFSLSDDDPWVYYTENDKVVAKLSLPARLNVIVTTEIHSGLKAFNPYDVVHFPRTWKTDFFSVSSIKHLRVVCTWIGVIPSGLIS